MATVLVALDAVDVAMTEASVGAGISTVLLLGALFLCNERGGPARAQALAAAWPWRSSVGALLVYGTLGLPEFSDPQAPIHTHVVPRYLQRSSSRKSACRTSSPPCSRATAATTRWARRRWSLPPAPASSRLLRRRRKDRRDGMRRRPDPARGRQDAHPVHPAVRAVRPVPWRLRPRRRLSGRVILAAAVIFYALIFGLADARKVVPEPLVESMMAIGVLIYAGVGVAGLLLGGNYLDYFVLDRDPVHGQHRGIFWVEVGVGDHGLGRDAEDLLHVRRPRQGGRVTSTDRRRAGSLHLLHHHLPDDGGPLHRHRARQPDQEAGRAEHLPDLGLPALHRSRQAGRRHGADPQRGLHASTRIRCRTC